MKLLLFPLCLVMTANISMAQFQWLNPKPTGFLNNKIEFINSKTGFIFNTNGDLIKTTNRGVTWQVYDNFPNGLCMDVQDSTAVIGGYSGTLYISLDNGTTWQKLVTSISETFEYVDVVGRDTFFLSNHLNSNIYKTVDRGKTFTKLQSPVPVQSMEFINSKTGYIGGATSLIYKTTDGGLTWQQKFIGSSFISSIEFITKDTGFACTDFGDLLVTNDAGNTWTSNRVGSSLYTTDFINGKDGYLGGEVGALYATHDGGKTFSDISYDPTDGDNIYSIYFFSRDTGFLVGELGRIMKTFNAGKTWIPYSPTYHPITSVSFGSAVTGYATTANRLYKTIDKGQKWLLQNLTTGINPPSSRLFEKSNFISSDTGFVTSSNPVQGHKTDDGGATWKTISIAADAYTNATDLQFISKNTGFMALRNFTNNTSCIVKTKDGGNTWQQIWKSISNEYFDQIFYLSESTGYATRYYQLFKTTDSSKTWTPVYTSPNGYKLVDVWFVSAQKGYISDGYTLISTNDSSKTWTTPTSQFSGAITTFKFYNNRVGYVSSGNQFVPSNNGYIYQTIDSGATWQLKINASGNSFEFTPDTAVVVAGFGGNILRSEIRELKIDSLSAKSLPPCNNLFSVVITALESKADSIAFELTRNNGTVIFLPATPYTVQNGQYKCVANDSTRLENGDYSIRVKCLYNGQYKYSEKINYTITGRPVKSVITRTDNTLYSSYQSGNQWYRNDTLISGANQNTYVIPMPVRYLQCYTVKTVVGSCITISDKLCVNDIILPLASLQLIATLADNNAIIKWETKSELNTDYFIIQRSVDGINFSETGKVISKGFSNTPTSYSFTDFLSNITGTIYYRIKSFDKDGSVVYSNVAVVHKLQNTLKVLISPNPANTSTTVYFNETISVKSITVFDAYGRKIFAADLKNEMRSSYMLNTATLKSGIYLLNVIKGDHKFSAKFIIVR